MRHSIRLVLLDHHDRLPLFSSIDETDGHTFWYPIGGGRWWTLPDLTKTPDRLAPAELISRLTDLLLKGPLAEPITLDA